jgi:hypothetical protein
MARQTPTTIKGLSGWRRSGNEINFGFFSGCGTDRLPHIRFLHIGQERGFNCVWPTALRPHIFG